MKKILLLSVVASTMIMAGGDIAPVEPVVEAPIAEAWNFDGDMVAYTQTADGDNQKPEYDGFDEASGNVIDLGACHHSVKVRP